MGIFDSAKLISEAKVATGGGIFERAKALSETAPEISAPEVLQTTPEEPGIFKGTKESVKAFSAGEIKTRDVIKGLPKATGDVAKGFANTFFPAVTNFFNTTGSILGEGLAYAIDPNVRKQFKAGNLDILPVVSDTTQADIARSTIAAGIETAVYRSFPNIAKKQLISRGGAGALQGLGFAVADGLAEQKSAEEVISNLKAFGVLGGVTGVITPYLLPLLKAEMRAVPKEIRNTFKGLKEEAVGAKPKKADVPVKEPVAVEQTAKIAEQVDETVTVAEQPVVRAERPVEVPSQQLPVGEGTQRVSRLEARIKRGLDKIDPAKAEAEGLSTFGVASDREQIRKGLEFATKNQDEAMAVLRGEKTAPEGILHNSIALAMEEIAEDSLNRGLAVRLASLRSTRAGQEISFLRNFDPNNPISKIAEVIAVRLKVAEKKLGASTTVAREIGAIKKGVSDKVTKNRLKIADVQRALDEIIC